MSAWRKDLRRSWRKPESLRRRQDERVRLRRGWLGRLLSWLKLAVVLLVVGCVPVQAKQRIADGARFNRAYQDLYSVADVGTAALDLAAENEAEFRALAEILDVEPGDPIYLEAGSAPQ